MPKTVALNIERIASCLWPTAEEFIFPLDASKCANMIIWTSNEIASYGCVHFSSGPQRTFKLLVRDVQLLTKISSNPLLIWLAANLVGSHHKTGCDVQCVYVRYSSPGSIRYCLNIYIEVIALISILIIRYRFKPLNIDPTNSISMIFL